MTSDCLLLPLISPTCQIEFEDAQGWLIGTENRGLNHMFTFINTSRVGTAVQVKSDGVGLRLIASDCDGMEAAWRRHGGGE